jgi:predicted transcriptional regulator
MCEVLSTAVACKLVRSIVEMGTGKRCEHGKNKNTMKGKKVLSECQKVNFFLLSGKT